jgi:hypothetical protein
VTTSKLQPVVIGPPLIGDSWEAANGCCAVNSHGQALVPIGGRLNGTERFAVDWQRPDVSAKPLVQNGVEITFKGDPSKNESYLAFNQPLIAVADGTVVRVVSGMPDIPPGTPPPIPLDQFAGNIVILDLGHGVFALYAHIKQNSVTVKVGDKVTAGSVTPATQLRRTSTSGSCGGPSRSPTTRCPGRSTTLRWSVPARPTVSSANRVRGRAPMSFHWPTA